jgi:carboxylesterase type B
VEDGLRIFLGVPYAAPPIGKLRWKPPQRTASWTELRSCKDFSPSCPQPAQQDAGGRQHDVPIIVGRTQNEGNMSNDRRSQAKTSGKGIEIWR